MDSEILRYTLRQIRRKVRKAVKARDAKDLAAGPRGVRVLNQSYYFTLGFNQILCGNECFELMQRLSRKQRLIRVEVVRQFLSADIRVEYPLGLQSHVVLLKTETDLPSIENGVVDAVKCAIWEVENKHV